MTERKGDRMVIRRRGTSSIVFLTKYDEVTINFKYGEHKFEGGFNYENNFSDPVSVTIIAYLEGQKPVEKEYPYDQTRKLLETILRDFRLIK